MFKTERPIASIKEDLLGRSNTARELGKHILEYKDDDSLTIGIIGNWGSGKTSFINMCLEDIKNNEDYTIIHFNPWNISTRKQLISDFFMQLANEIKSDSEKNAEDAAIKAGKDLKLLSKFFKPVSNLNIPLISSVATILNSTYEGAAEYLEDYIKLQEMDLNSLKKQLNNSLEELNKKVIIVIDDIDRLSDDEIREIFQLVKSIADFKNTIYLLSYDEDIVGSALDHLQNGRGKEYLEKIVQVPIQLPYIGKEEINKIFVEKLVKTLQISKEDFYKTYFDTICWNGFQNNMESMRDVERYMNAFKFRMNFAKRELNIYDYMVITLFKVFEPPLFKYIQEHPDLFADITFGREDVSDTPEEREFVKKCIDEQLNSLQKLNSIKARKLIYVIFPKVRMLYQGSTPNETFLSPWNKERRIASPDYFKNYFSLEFSSTQINRETLEKIVKFESKEDLIQSFNIEPSQRLRLLSALSNWIDEIKKDKRLEFLYFLLGIEDTFKPKEPNTFNYYLHNPLFYISSIYEQLIRGI